LSNTLEGAGVEVLKEDVLFLLGWGGGNGRVVILVDEEEEAGGAEGRGEGGMAGWIDEVTTGVPGGRGLPWRKAAYCSLVILGGVTTGKSERRRRKGEGRSEKEKKRKKEEKKRRRISPVIPSSFLISLLV
jgi:hypothetical protein